MKRQPARKIKAQARRAHKRSANTQQRQKAAKRVPMIVNRAQARSNRQRRTFALPVAIPKPRVLDMTRWLETRKAG